MITKVSFCCSAATRQDLFGWVRCEACGRIQRDGQADEPRRGYVYLASPYSHPLASVRQARYEAARASVVAHFVEKVWVYSPIVHNHDLPGLPTDAAHWLEYNHTMIDHAIALHVLKIPGWAESVGVKEEIAYATRLGLPVRDVFLPMPPTPHADYLGEPPR